MLPFRMSTNPCAVAMTIAAALGAGWAARPAPAKEPPKAAAKEPAKEPAKNGADSTDSDKSLGAKLTRYESRSYHVFHNLSAAEAKLFASHMDAVFDEYSARFANLSSSKPRPMPLYLFRKQAEYEAFMASIDINAANTGGMFFVTRKDEGLATFVGDRPVTQTFAVLQHEGFHQFAHRHIGPDLPIWVNEGIAQYFEDGVLVGRKMYVGPANAGRVAAVKQALAKNEQFDFDTLLNISNEQWSKNVVEGKREAALQYDQSWSIAYFLIVGENGRYRDAFEKYLKLVAQRRPGSDPEARARSQMRAFSEAFGTTDTTAFKQRWTEFARALEPDAINMAVTKLEFMGQALRYLHKQKAPMPASVAELRAKLQKMQFSTVTIRNGVRSTSDSRDESIYSFNVGNGKTKPFVMLKADGGKDALPPRIVAEGMRPKPTLVWYLDGEGDLTMDVAFSE